MENDCGTEPWNINYSTNPDGSANFGYFNVLGLAGLQSTTEQQMVSVCEIQFGDICQQKICKIEMNFVRQQVILNSELIDVNTIHANGFDPLTDPRCNVENGFDSDRACCGEYPNRFPYKINARDGTSRQCCGDRTYNDSMYVCCSGEIETLGSC